MEISGETIQNIASFMPGNFAVYQLKDGGLRTVYFSPGVPGLSGRTSEEYINEVVHNAIGAVLDDDREFIRAAFTAAAGGAETECSYRLSNKKGGFAWIHIRLRLIGEWHGSPAILVVFLNSPAESELYQALVDHSSSRVMVVDRKSLRILYVNRAAREAKRGGGVNFADSFCYEYSKGCGKRCADCLMDSMKPGEVREQEHPGAEGETIDHVSAQLITWCGHDACVFYIDDVTSRKLAEIRYENALRDLLSASPHTLCAFRLNLTRDLCGKAYGTSGRVKKLLQSNTVDELFAKAAGMIENEKERGDYRAIFSRRAMLEDFSRGNARLAQTFRRLSDEGQLRWVTLTVNMMNNPRTGDVEAIAYSLDTNDAKKEESIIQRLATMEYDYICTVETATRRINYRRLGAGARATCVFETNDYDEDLDLSLKEYMSPEEQEQTKKLASLDNIIAEIEKNGVYSFVCAARLADGEVLRKKLLHCWLDDSKREILIIKSDVTEVYRQEQEQLKKLQDALLAAEQANEMKSEFLSNVSHDMRTPLNGVIGYTDLAISSGSETAIREYLGKIRQSSEVLLQLINDTLDLSKIETGAVTLKPEPIDCGAFIRRLVTAVKPSMNDKHIKFVLDDEHACKGSLLADPLRLQEIFINLLSNAVKFTEPGGRIEFAVYCQEREDGRCDAEFVVRDSGVGISKAFLPRLFEPFSQERTAATAGIGGSGLGLSIVKRLVELMGGGIEVKSELDRGSEFTVRLSFDHTEAARPKARECVRTDELSGKKVLLCEDNPINTEIARTLLESKGLSVVCAADGKAGLEAFGASGPGEFAAILMDIRMPIMKGYEAAQKIRALDRPDAGTVPIIAMTADAYEDDVKRCLDSGMNAHIAKPIDSEKLFEELSKYCK